MRKFLALLLALTMMICCGMTAFAETGGSQTITLEVPEPEVIVPVFIIKKPVVGEKLDYNVTVNENAQYADKYYARLLEVRVDDTQISGDGSYVCAAGTYKYKLSAWLNDDSAGYIIRNETNATVLVDTGKQRDDGTEIYEGYRVPRTNVNGYEPWAEYEFTLDIAPSWTLTIPSTQTITFGVENNPVNLNTFVTGVENLSDSVNIYVFAKYDGVFRETSDDEQTISYTLKNGNGSSYERNKLFRVNTNVKGLTADARSDHQAAENTVLYISNETWKSAEPGSYETTITYTSSLDEDPTGQNG